MEPTKPDSMEINVWMPEERKHTLSHLGIMALLTIAVESIVLYYFLLGYLILFPKTHSE